MTGTKVAATRASGREGLGWPRPFFVVVAAWTIVGLLRGAQASTARSLMGGGDTRTTAFFDPLLAAWVWAALTPAVVRLCRAVPFSRDRLGRAFAVHLAAAPVFATIHDLIFQPLMVVVKLWTLDPMTHVVNTVSDLVMNMPRLLMTSLATVGAFSLWQSARASQAAALGAAALEAELDEARVLALATRLAPTFYLRTLDTLEALIPRAPAEAEDLVERLGDLMRLSARYEDSETMPLRDELASVDLTLAIESTRLDGALSASVDADPRCLDADMPSFFLRPLVEHAVANGSGPGGLQIRASDREGRLVVTMEGGTAAGGTASPAPAVAAATRRLETIFGRDHRFDWNVAGDRVAMSLEIPFTRRGAGTGRGSSGSSRSA